MATALSRQLKASRRHWQVLAGSNCLKSPASYLMLKQNKLRALSDAMAAVQNRQISLKKQRFVALTAKLDAMSPLKVLTRGYAMAQTEEGSVLKSVKQVSAGESITVSLSDGMLRSTVMEVKENLYESK